MEEIPLLQIMPFGLSCSCKATRCLKKYCRCYAAGQPCGTTCKCSSKECANLAWGEPASPVSVTCACKALDGRATCSMGYCACRKAGRACTEACKCAYGCRNAAHSLCVTPSKKPGRTKRARPVTSDMEFDRAVRQCFLNGALDGLEEV